MGCRNINISVALTYQLLRLIGLSLVWRCLSRGVVCTFNHLLRRYGRYGAVAALGARPQGLTERRSLRTQIFSSLSRSEWVTGKKKVSPQFAQCFILIRFCIPFWRHLLKVLSSKVVTTNQAMTLPWLLEVKDKDKCLEKRGEMERECAWMKNSHVAGWSDSHPPFSRGWKIKINPGKSEPPESKAEQTSLYHLIKSVNLAKVQAL